MSVFRVLSALSGKRSQTGAIILDSFKRHYPKIDPASIDKSIDRENVELHSKLADQWWDPQKNPLHALNEIRVPFMRNCLLNTGQIYTSDGSLEKVLDGVKVLDVGCGGGILCEALARLRCDVVGIDASAELIEVAKEHAARDKLVENNVRYENSDLPEVSSQHAGTFDLVVVSEVLEHISDKEYFLRLCIKCLKDGGSLFITTPNRTLMSKIFLVDLSEFMRIVPFGTHDYSKFITPRELAVLLKDLNCMTKHLEGIVYNPWSRKFDTHRYTMFMYALHAVKKLDGWDGDVLEDNKFRSFCS